MKKFFGRRDKLPIVFSSQYNVTFCGLQCLYPFDTEKGQHILRLLKAAEIITDDKLTMPMEIQDYELLEVHTEEYLDSLRVKSTFAEIVGLSGIVIMRIAEMPLLYFVPNTLIDHGYLKPMRYQTGGSITAAKAALREGWSINLGGGFSHCSKNEGGSFSPYADVTLMTKFFLLGEKNVSKVMIIDLSARQGNGYAKDFIGISSVYIFDMYNSANYPQDEHAKLGISRAVELPPQTEDEVYLRKLRINLAKAFGEFRPDVLIYIAGTDVLDGDTLGQLSVSHEGIVQRDEIIFCKARQSRIPIVMLLGLGFTKAAAQIVTSSIINLKEKGYLPSKSWPK